MLAIPGKNPMGNVLHLVVGPESELIMDMQGAIIMDVTQIINKFVTSEPVYVSLSRSRNEIMTSASLKQANVPHMGITGTPERCDGDCDHCKVGPDGTPVSQAKPDKKMTKVVEKCSYCQKLGPVLPIPGFKICTSCAQIELGVNNLKKKAAPSTPIPAKDTPDANQSHKT